MRFKNILVTKRDRIGWVTLNRPEKLNALSLELCGEVKTAITQLDHDDEIRVVVVHGSGDRAFSAGYDLEEDIVMQTDASYFHTRLNMDLEFTFSVWNCSKPVIAMIDGYCLAGGLEFAQMCDVRYCSDRSKFAVIETRFSYGVATLAMPWVVGARSRELIYTGDMFDAGTARHIGLVNRVFSSDELRQQVEQIAGRMSRVALKTLRWNKRALNQTYETMGFVPAMRYGVEACVMMDSTPSPESEEFDRLRRTEGLQAALRWRAALFAEFGG